MFSRGDEPRRLTCLHPETKCVFTHRDKGVYMQRRKCLHVPTIRILVEMKFMISSGNKHVYTRKWTRLVAETNIFSCGEKHGYTQMNAKTNKRLCPRRSVKEY